MSMTMRERILAVYRGETPDTVPCILDLSHWFHHGNGVPWDLSRADDEPEYELIDCHRRLGVAYYVPELASTFIRNRFPEGAGTCPLEPA